MFQKATRKVIIEKKFQKYLNDTVLFVLDVWFQILKCEHLHSWDID